MDLDRIKALYEKIQRTPNIEEYLEKQLTKAVFSGPCFTVSCDTADSSDEGVKVTYYRDEYGNIIDITFDRIHKHIKG